MTTSLRALRQWVDEVAALARPQRIQWCTGSDAEYQHLIKDMLAAGTLTQLDPATHPDCYLHLSDPTDVARVEHLTFVCTSRREDAGPNNLWMAPREGHARIDALFAGAMQERTMYVVPYCMGPLIRPMPDAAWNSPIARTSSST